MRNTEKIQIGVGITSIIIGIVGILLATFFSYSANKMMKSAEARAKKAEEDKEEAKKSELKAIKNKSLWENKYRRKEEREQFMKQVFTSLKYLQKQLVATDLVMEHGTTFDITWIRKGRKEAFELRRGILGGGAFEKDLRRMHNILEKTQIKTLYLIGTQDEENFDKVYDKFLKKNNLKPKVVYIHYLRMSDYLLMQ